jgi:hypothetical protein
LPLVPFSARLAVAGAFSASEPLYSVLCARTRL